MSKPCLIVIFVFLEFNSTRSFSAILDTNNSDPLPDVNGKKDGRERKEGVQLTDRESRTLHRR